LLEGDEEVSSILSSVQHCAIWDCLSHLMNQANFTGIFSALCFTNISCRRHLEMTYCFATPTMSRRMSL
jgi:hypothetical protein